MKIHDFQRKKAQKQKISMVTCYDYPSARILSESHADCVLVGDSVAMAMHGHENTITATMEMMILHTKAVARGLTHQFLIADLPCLSHRISEAETVRNVKQLLQAGADAIKMEGGDEDVCQSVRKLVTAGVPVMGHIGLTPQSILQLGGWKIQGKQAEQANLLIHQAQQLEAAGCFAIVVECVPKSLGTAITNALRIPTIGIGAGPETDGQVLVWHDLLGLQTEFKPRFVKQFATGKQLFLDAINAYVEQVNQAHFPTTEHSF